jgi:hypothetical protein
MTTDSGNNSTATGAPPPRWVLKTFTGIHMVLHRLSGGRLFNTLGGDEVCFVTMKGAKSGRSLTIPLMYAPYAEYRTRTNRDIPIFVCEPAYAG